MIFLLSLLIRSLILHLHPQHLYLAAIRATHPLHYIAVLDSGSEARCMCTVERWARDLAPIPTFAACDGSAHQLVQWEKNDNFIPHCRFTLKRVEVWLTLQSNQHYSVKGQTSTPNPGAKNKYQAWTPSRPTILHATPSPFCLFPDPHPEPFTRQTI